MFLKKIKDEIKSIHDKLFSLKESFIYKHDELELKINHVKRDINYSNNDFLELHKKIEKIGEVISSSTIEKINELRNEIQYFKFQAENPPKYKIGDKAQVFTLNFTIKEGEKNLGKMRVFKVIKREVVKLLDTNEYKWSYTVQHPNTKETTTID